MAEDEDNGLDEAIKLYGPGAAMYYLAKKLSEAVKTRGGRSSSTTIKSKGASTPRLQTQVEADLNKRKRAMSRAYRAGYDFGKALGFDDNNARRLADQHAERALKRIEGKEGTPRMTRPMEKFDVRMREKYTMRPGISPLADVGMTALLGYESLKLGKATANRVQRGIEEKKANQAAADRALIDRATEAYLRERMRP